MESTLNIYCQNVNGLNTKENDLVNEINCGNFDILGLTESWFKKDRNYFEQLSQRYTVIRKDRELSLTQKCKGGGCVLLINSDLKYETIKTPFPQLDIIMIKLYVQGTPPVLIVLHYFPPD